MTTCHYVLTKVALEATTVHSTKSTLTRRLSVVRQGLIIVLIMICGDDVEDAGDNNIGAN